MHPNHRSRLTLELNCLPGEPNIDHHVLQFLLFCYSIAAETCVSEPLADNGLPLWLHYFGFQASCHIMLLIYLFSYLKYVIKICYIDTIKKTPQTLIDASKEVGLEVNTEKTKYTKYKV
jgi:hypothetical protein